MNALHDHQPDDNSSHLRLVTDEEIALHDFDSLFKRFAPYVASIGLRLLGRPDEVDDLVQDVFLEAHRHLHKVREPKAIKGWLAPIAVRTARRRLRWRRAKKWIGLDDTPDYHNITASGASPEQQALLSDIFRILDTIPVDARLAWSLRHIEGERLNAVAERCDCSLATAKRRIARAQAILDEVLQS